VHDPQSAVPVRTTSDAAAISSSIAAGREDPGLVQRRIGQQLGHPPQQDVGVRLRVVEHADAQPLQAGAATAQRADVVERGAERTQESHSGAV